MRVVQYIFYKHGALKYIHEKIKDLKRSTSYRILPIALKRALPIAQNTKLFLIKLRWRSSLGYVIIYGYMHTESKPQAAMTNIQVCLFRRLYQCLHSSRGVPCQIGSPCAQRPMYEERVTLATFLRKSNILES